MKSLSSLHARKTFRLSMTLVILLLLSACAVGPPIRHGIQIEAKGPQPITDVEIIYGVHAIRLKTPSRSPNDSDWRESMSIPNWMRVGWKAQDKSQAVAISLQDRLPHGLRLDNWIVVLEGERMELWREYLEVMPGTLDKTNFRDRVYPAQSESDAKRE